MKAINVAKSKICKKCGKTFAPRSNSSKICDKCFTYKCEFCGKKFLSRRKRKIRFCSVECTNNWQSTSVAKEAASSRTISIRGRGKIQKCETCRETFYAPGWLLDKNGGRYCSHICRRLSLNLICPICGKGFKRPPSDIRTENYCSNNCRDKGTAIRLANGTIFTKTTQLEIAGRELLNELEFDYVEQKVIGFKYVVDVLIPVYNLIVQWDGDFWHGNPIKYPKLSPIQKKNRSRDKKCDRLCFKIGYQVKRFWESDVYERPQWVKNEIRKAIRS